MKSKKKRSGSISTTPVRKSRNMPDQDNREPIEINGSTVTFAPSVETESEIESSKELKLEEKDEYKLVLKTPASESDVTWWKDDKEISSECIDDTDLNERTMTIPNVEIDDSGVYQVKGPNFDLKVNLKVTRGLKFIDQPPRFIEKSENEECSLPYKFTQKLWKMKFYKGEQLKPSERVVISESAGVRKLVIHRLEESDSGEYYAMCEDVPSRPTNIVVKKRPLSAGDSNDKEYLNDAFLLKLAEELTKEDWHALGPELAFSSGQISSFEEDNKASKRQKIYSMLQAWRNKQESGGETQVRCLANKLAAIQRADLKRLTLEKYKLD